MQKLSAPLIFPISSPPIQNGVVMVDDDGKILALDQRENHDPASLRLLEGAIVPGFVNAHCHLELSHMKGVAPTGTGLLPFLKTVVNHRNVSQEQILDAIEQADQEMFEAGIVAVGDISNKADTAATKAKSNIRYYTFVEMFDFLNDEWAEKTFNDYYEVFKQQPGENGHRKSCVPHAPYTVSPNLFKLINEANRLAVGSFEQGENPELASGRQSSVLSHRSQSAYTTRKRYMRTSFLCQKRAISMRSTILSTSP